MNQKLGFVFLCLTFYFGFVNVLRADLLFDVTSVTTGENGIATGISNGVGFMLTPTYIHEPRTIIDGSFTGYSDSGFHNPPLANSDVLHIGRDGFTLIFDEVISSALIYFTDNPPGVDSEMDFGIVPTVISGDVSVNGTRFRPTTLSGGLIRLDGIDSNTLTHIPQGSFLDMDFAIVVSTVPEPSSIVLVNGLLWIVVLRRRNHN